MANPVPFKVDREGFQPIFEKFLEDGKLWDDSGYAGFFENEIFIIRPFWWGDCECGFAEDNPNKLEYHADYCRVAQPNFVYKPKNLRIDWYKYPLRSASSNKEFSQGEFSSILKHCLKSLNPEEPPKQPCMNCGSTEWMITMITDCDVCNPKLRPDFGEKK